jgi:hypothetical protein
VCIPCSVAVNARMRQVPSTPRHHVRGCPAGSRSGIGVLRGRLRQPYRRRQSGSPIPRREQRGIGRLRVGWRWRQYANPARKHENRDQDSDHGVVHPSAAGFRYAAPTALQAASALPAQRTKNLPEFDLRDNCVCCSTDRATGEHGDANGGTVIQQPSEAHHTVAQIRRLWRKEWDSNPRGSGTPCWFSRPVP